MKVILKFAAVTNRGLTEFIISETDKGFFAHELGDLTQWAKVFHTQERKAYRLNPRKRYGNQYGRYWRETPVKTLSNAFDLCRANISQVTIHY